MALRIEDETIDLVMRGLMRAELPEAQALRRVATTIAADVQRTLNAARLVHSAPFEAEHRAPAPSVAREMLGRLLADDEGLRAAYVANVAMLLHDRFNGADFTDRETRERAAHDVLALLCGLARCDGCGTGVYVGGNALGVLKVTCGACGRTR